MEGYRPRTKFKFAFWNGGSALLGLFVTMGMFGDILQMHLLCINGSFLTMHLLLNEKVFRLLYHHLNEKIFDCGTFA